MPQMIIREPGGSRTAQVTGELTSIGRAAENQLPLRDTSLSRKHCEIRRKGKHFILCDLGSRNGTLVNGASIKEHRLERGDKIEIGNSMLIFEEEIPGRDYGVTHSSGGAARSSSDESGTRTTTKRAVERSLATPDDYLSWSRASNPLPWVLSSAAVVLLGAGAWGISAWRDARPRATFQAADLLAPIGSFEEAEAGGGGPKGWELRPGEGGTMARSDAVARTGKASLRLDAAAAGSATCVGKCEVPAARGGGQGYLAAVWCRLEGGGGAFLRVSWPGTEAPADLAVAAGGSSKEWVRLEVPCSAPEGAKQAELALGVLGSVAVFFDDASLVAGSVPATAPPARALGPFAASLQPGRPFALRLGEAPVLAEGIAFLRKGDAVLSHVYLAEARVAARASPYGERLSLSGRLPVPSSAAVEELGLDFTPAADGAGLSLAPPAEKASAEVVRGIGFLLPGRASARVRGSTGEEEVRERAEVSGVSLLVAGAGASAFVLRYARPATVRVAQAPGGLWIEQWLVDADADGARVGLSFLVAAGEGALAAVSSGASLENAKTLEAAGSLGKALAAYREAVKLGKLPPIDLAESSSRGKALERRATAALADLRRQAEEAPVPAEPEACDDVAREINAFLHDYEGSEFAEQAKPLLEACEKAKVALRQTRERAEATRLLGLARQFLADQKPTLAALHLRDLLERLPSSESAAEARDLLAKCVPRR